MLLSCEEWGTEDGLFILKEFYYAILEMFDDKEDEWVVETLAWWNEYVFILFSFPTDPVSFYRQIFPDVFKTCNAWGKSAEPDPNSAWSRAKLARLDRARQCHALAQ
jgi:hypothetical protein